MKTVIAKRIDEVVSVLEFAEREARSGSHVAVMLSYEAAPAFDSAFVAQPPSDFPLAWAHTVAQGRAVYTALGHFDSTWTDPRFQSHLRGAIAWAAGRD